MLKSIIDKIPDLISWPYTPVQLQRKEKGALTEANRNVALKNLSSYQRKYFKKSFGGHFELEDQWSSIWTYMLTPLDDQIQTLSVSLSNSSSQYHFGKNNKVKLAVSEPYYPTNEGLSYLDKLYFYSLDYYLRLPHLITTYSNVYQLTPSKTEFRLFASTSLENPFDPRSDQLIIHLNKRTLKLTAIQFTFRRLRQSYRGWIIYGPLKKYQKMSYPSFFTIQRSRHQKGFDHKIKVLSLR